MFSGEERQFYIETIQELLKDSVTFFCEYVPAESYDFDLSSVLDGSNYYRYSYEVENLIEEMIKDSVRDDLNIMLETLPVDINRKYIDISSIDIHIEGVERIILDYYRDCDDDRFYEERKIDEFLEESEIENIFNR